MVNEDPTLPPLQGVIFSANEATEFESKKEIPASPNTQWTDEDESRRIDLFHNFRLLMLLFFFRTFPQSFR